MESLPVESLRPDRIGIQGRQGANRVDQSIQRAVDGIGRAPPVETAIGIVVDWGSAPGMQAW